MSGLAIAAELLAADAAFTAKVAEGDWDYWELPQGTGLPSVLLTIVSHVEKDFLAAQAFVMVTERVQATIRAGSGAEREELREIIRSAWRDKLPIAAGLTGVAVKLAGEGPDFKDGDAGIYIGSLDARVSFTKPA